jgi:hypothetical protein
MKTMMWVIVCKHSLHESIAPPRREDIELRMHAASTNLSRKRRRCMAPTTGVIALSHQLRNIITVWLQVDAVEQVVLGLRRP